MPKVTEKKTDTTDVDQRVEVAGGDIDVKEESGFYEAYRDYARNIRTWFIAYGIGGPVLLATSESAWQAIRASGLASTVIYCFFGGVALQIIGALIYKTAMWYLYLGEIEEISKNLRRYRVSGWFSVKYYIDVGFDILTLALFGMATWAALTVLVG